MARGARLIRSLGILARVCEIVVAANLIVFTVLDLFAPGTIAGTPMQHAIGSGLALLLFRAPWAEQGAATDG